MTTNHSAKGWNLVAQGDSYRLSDNKNSIESAYVQEGSVMFTYVIDGRITRVHKDLVFYMGDDSTLLYVITHFPPYKLKTVTWPPSIDWVIQIECGEIRISGTDILENKFVSSKVRSIEYVGFHLVRILTYSTSRNIWEVLQLWYDDKKVLKEDVVSWFDDAIDRVGLPPLVDDDYLRHLSCK